MKQETKNTLFAYVIDIWILLLNCRVLIRLSYNWRRLKFWLPLTINGLIERTATVRSANRIKHVFFSWFHINLQLFIRLIKLPCCCLSLIKRRPCYFVIILWPLWCDKKIYICARWWNPNKEVHCFSLSRSFTHSVSVGTYAPACTCAYVHFSETQSHTNTHIEWIARMQTGAHGPVSNK